MANSPCLVSRRLLESFKQLALVATCLLAAIAYFTIPPPTDYRPQHLFDHVTLTRDNIRRLGPVSGPSGMLADRRLRLFMPADKPTLTLCKSVMSAIALGYPPPTLLNWDKHYNRPGWHFAGSHIAKLESLLAAIEELLANRDDVDRDDIALLVDGYDTWFQLPPHVLIERFHQLNKEADKRVEDQWHHLCARGFPLSPPKQSIVVSTAKHCFPDASSGSNPHYRHWPDSPMPADLYGPATDFFGPYWADVAQKFQKVRPRCVNSGFIMGTFAALRDVMRRAKEKADAVTLSGRQLWSDQSLLGEVIGDQEMWRKFVRELGDHCEDGKADLCGVRDKLNKFPEVMRIAERAILGERFEFGIGLDYNSTTIPPTSSSETDAYFVKFSNRTALRAEYYRVGVYGNGRVQDIPAELRDVPTSVPLHNVSWRDEPLYTDFFMGTSPVGIHHNAYINNLKTQRLSEWWSKMWFYPYLRKLLTVNLTPVAQQRPIAVVQHPGVGATGGTVTYWMGKEEGKAMKATWRPRNSPGDSQTLEWDEVCTKGWEDELIGDGKGALII